jgi:hypothetical protein
VFASLEKGEEWGGNGFDDDAAIVMFKRLVKEGIKRWVTHQFCSFVLLRKFETCASFFETFYVIFCVLGKQVRDKERKAF